MLCEPFSVDVHWDPWEKASAGLELGDRYCSSPHWGVPLLAAFAGGPRPMVYSWGENLAIFHQLDVQGGRLHLPCDSMWTLGSPILGPDPTGMLERLCEFWRSQGGLHQATLSGLYEGHSLWSSSLWDSYANWSLPSAGRQVASLEGGSEGFLSRRSVNFRSRLRRAVKKAEQSGIEIEYFPHSATLSETLELLRRAFAVEAQSWKGLNGQGIDSGSMATFYRHMLPLLAQRGRLRGLFLRRDGKDLSYLFGAAFAEYFRGLQFSYLETEDESLGNIGQWHMIVELAKEGCRAYDLGQAMAYKTRWAEQWIVSPTMGLEVRG